jgi:hypothetical protein
MTENSNSRRSSMRTRGFGACAADRLLWKLDALQKGKTIVETIANPDKKQTSKRFIKIRRKLKEIK